MFSFGCFPGVWVLTADVSEHTIGSIFKGRSMKYDRGWDVWGIYTRPGSGRSVAEPMGRWVAGWGRLGWGRYIRRVRVGTLYYTATQTQEKETATEYNTVIPPAHALYTSPLLTTPNRLLTFSLAPPPTSLNLVWYKYPTHPSPCHTSSSCLWRWNRYCVQKGRLLALRCQGKNKKKHITETSSLRDWRHCSTGLYKISTSHSYHGFVHNWSWFGNSVEESTWKADTKLNSPT
jgi:hypothetical protein